MKRVEHIHQSGHEINSDVQGHQKLIMNTSFKNFTD